MRTLYLKIFPWFWLAMVLVTATLVLSIGLTQSRVTNARVEEMERTLVPLLAERSAKIYEKQGQTGLSANGASMRGPGTSQAYFLSESGQDVLRQTLPSETKSIIQKVRQ